MNLKPLDDRVIVRPHPPEERTAGGIVLPDTAKEKPLHGMVIAVGPGRLLNSGERSPIALAVGDVVLFAKYSGTEVQVEGQEAMILRESEILALYGNPMTGRPMTGRPSTKTQSPPTPPPPPTPPKTQTK